MCKPFLVSFLKSFQRCLNCFPVFFDFLISLTPERPFLRDFGGFFLGFWKAPWSFASFRGSCGKWKVEHLQCLLHSNLLWVKKKTPTGTTGFGPFFLLPIGFFGHPVFLTHTQICFEPWNISPQTRPLKHPKTARGNRQAKHFKFCENKIVSLESKALFKKKKKKLFKKKSLKKKTNQKLSQGHPETPRSLGLVRCPTPPLGHTGPRCHPYCQPLRCPGNPAVVSCRGCLVFFFRW